MAKKVECSCKLIDGVKKQCKHCYDKNRRIKMKNGDWNFNRPMPDVLTSEQEQILIGGLLGDFYLYQNKNNINAGISCGRSLKDKKYMEFEYSLFKDFCNEGVKKRNYFDKRTNQIYYGVWFRTRVSKVFTPYKKKWYSNGEKIVPRDLKLTPLICAIWFCDDGSIIYVGKNKTGRRISLYTDNFSKKEVIFLRKLLKSNLGILFRMTRKKSMEDPNKGFYLYIDNKYDIHKFVMYIKDVMPLSMSRKSDRWKGFV
jgi:LAGLIDADG DNA endonuclease family